MRETIPEHDGLVIDTAATWLRAEGDVYLVTLLSAFGSSPRPAGTVMAICRDGSFAGSLSGGCLEDDLREKIATTERQFPWRIDYSEENAVARRLGLPCGGRLSLLIENLRFDASFLRFAELLRQGLSIRRSVDLNTGEVRLQIEDDDLTEFSHNENTISKRFGPSWRILVIGANMIAYYLAQFALAAQFDVIICDPRETHSMPAIPTGCHFTQQMPDDAVQEFAYDTRSAVVALAHDPKHDDLALIDALVSPAFYVGALGSTRSAEKRARRLREMGLAATDIQRLRGPAGVPIGSKTPAEIAISILAEIIAYKNAIDTHRQLAHTTALRSSAASA